ncbi:MAG: BTAD domain-containing putative transcriptional regulator [Gemmatimonadota bacterium]
MIRFRALGTPVLERVQAGRTVHLHLQPKSLALLACLCLEGSDRPTRRDRIVFLLWPELGQSRARAALNQTIHRLRQQVGYETIVSLGQDELSFDRGRLSCDVVALEECLEDGRVDEALGIYAGDLLEGFHLSGSSDFERWLADRRERLREMVVGAAMGVAADMEKGEELSRGIGMLCRAVEISPLEEDAVRRLVLLLDQAGDSAGAVRAYERFAGQLQEEYDLVPSPETRWAVASVRARMTPTARPSVSESARPASIAVLPFRNPADRPDAVVFCDGLAEEVLSALGRVERLHVIARTSVFRFRSGEADPVEIGRRLGVDSVLEGSVQVADDRIRIHARLLECRSGALLWSRSYDRRLSIGELFAVQAGVARAIVNALEMELDPEAREYLSREPTEDLEAYSLCLRGRHAWSRRSPDALEEAETLFRRAIGRDSSYAAAWSGLADTLTLLPLYTPADVTESRREALGAASRALELDEGLAEAHAALARILEAERRWEESGREFRRALELNPNYATARHWYANHLLRLGRTDEGLLEIERAVRLDPLSPAVWMGRAFILCLIRRYEEAIDCASRVVEMEPAAEGARMILALAQVEGGDARQAVEMCEELARTLDSTRASGLLAYALARSGAVERARDILRAAECSAEPLTLAMAWTALGDLDRAFQCLANADWDTINVDVLVLAAAFDPLRADPRYRSLSAELGL